MMRAALIGLGMVSRTYGDALRNSNTVSLAFVPARSSESRASFLREWPDLEATSADSVAEIAAADVDFADVLRQNRPPIVTGRDALGVHQLISAMENSARTGSRTQVKDI